MELHAKDTYNINASAGHMRHSATGEVGDHDHLDEEGPAPDDIHHHMKMVAHHKDQLGANMMVAGDADDDARDVSRRHSHKHSMYAPKGTYADEKEDDGEEEEEEVPA